MERTWLGLVLLDERTLETSPVPPEDFYIPGHAVVARAMLVLRRSGLPIDTITLRVEILRTPGELARIGGDEMLLALTNQVPSTRTAHVVSARIREQAELRRRREHAQRIVMACNAGMTEDARMLSATIGAAHDPSTVAIRSFKEVAESTLRAYADIGTERDKTLKLGICDSVDAMWSPYPGSLTVIGARTGSGKTSVMCVSALSLARRGIPVGVISVEDAEEDFGGKWIGELGEANPSVFWKGEAVAADHERALRAVAENEGLPIYFGHVKSRKLDDVLGAMRVMARRYGTRVVMIDYLQAIRSRDRHKDRRDAIDAVLDEVIIETSMLDQALVLASQISREGGKQDQPRVADLKESGTIEDRSQAIILVWPDEHKKGVVHGQVAKVKRVVTGRRFTMVRNHKTGALEEEKDDFGGDDGDPGPTDPVGGYAVGNYGKGKGKAKKS